MKFLTLPQSENRGEIRSPFSRVSTIRNAVELTISGVAAKTKSDVAAKLYGVVQKVDKELFLPRYAPVFGEQARHPEHSIAKLAVARPLAEGTAKSEKQDNAQNLAAEAKTIQPGLGLVVSQTVVPEVIAEPTENQEISPDMDQEARISIAMRNVDNAHQRAA